MIKWRNILNLWRYPPLPFGENPTAITHIRYFLVKPTRCPVAHRCDWPPCHHGSSILSTSLGSKTLNTASLGHGRPKSGCRRRLAGIFHTPARCILAWRTCTFPSPQFPIMAKVGNQVLCPHSRCFGSYFDVICSMYLVSSGFSFKPISSSSIILIDPV